MGRYGKRADLIVHEDEPFNAETGLAALAEGSVTATDAFYVRGHGSVPDVDQTFGGTFSDSSPAPGRTYPPCVKRDIPWLGKTETPKVVGG